MIFVFSFESLEFVHLFESICFIPFLRQKLGCFSVKKSVHDTGLGNIPFSALTLHMERTRERRSTDSVQQLNTPKSAMEIGTMIQFYFNRDSGLQNTIKFRRPFIFPQTNVTFVTISHLVIYFLLHVGNLDDIHKQKNIITKRCFFCQ